jgi:hypothetical protein
VLCQLSYAPRVAGSVAPCPRRPQEPSTLALVQRRLLGLLFAALALCLGLVAVFSALEGGSAWVIALAASVLALWLGDLGRRTLIRRPR